MSGCNFLVLNHWYRKWLDCMRNWNWLCWDSWEWVKMHFSPLSHSITWIEREKGKVMEEIPQKQQRAQNPCHFIRYRRFSPTNRQLLVWLVWWPVLFFLSFLADIASVVSSVKNWEELHQSNRVSFQNLWVALVWKAAGIVLLAAGTSNVQWKRRIERRPLEISRIYQICA